MRERDWIKCCFVTFLFTITYWQSSAQNHVVYRLVKQINYKQSFNPDTLVLLDSTIYTYTGNQAYDSLSDDWAYYEKTASYFGAAAEDRSFEKSVKKYERLQDTLIISIKEYGKEDPIADWQLMTSTEYTYVDSLLYSEYQGTVISGKMKKSHIFLYYYDTLGRKVEWHINTGNIEKDIWVPNYRHYYSYDDSGLMTRDLSLNYIEILNFFDSSYIHYYKYKNGKIIQDSTLIKQYGGNWRPHYKYDYEYRNKETRIVSTLFWNPNDSLWNLKYKEYYRYDFYSGKLRRHSKEHYNDTGYVGKTRTDYLYEGTFLRETIKQTHYPDTKQYTQYHQIFFYEPVKNNTKKRAVNK